MAKLYISEYQFMGADGYGGSSIARTPPLINQVVDFTAGAAASEAFSAATTYIRVWSDTKCCLSFGVDPTATTGDAPLATSTPEFLGVTPGQKVSAITLT